MKIPCFRYVLVLSFLTAMMIYFYGRIDYTLKPYCDWDLKLYRSMAQAAPHINSEVTKPYAYRLLGPYLVGILPFSNIRSFCVVDTLLAFSLPLLLFWFLCRRGITPPISLLTTFFFLCNKYEFGMQSWDFFRVNDLASLIFIMIILESLINSWWLAFSICLLAGALTREVIMLLIPVAFLYFFENKKTRTEYFRLMLACLPGLIMFFALRIILSPPGRNLDEAFLIHVHKFTSPAVWGKLLLNAYAPASLIPIIFYKDTLKFFVKKKYAVFFVATVFFSTAFGTDNERLFAPVFIFVYWYVATVFQSMNLKFMDSTLLASVIFAFLASIHHEIGRFHIVSPSGMIGITIISLIGFSLVMFFKKMSVSNSNSILKDKNG
jgi:hypothetical protein